MNNLRVDLIAESFVLTAGLGAECLPTFVTVRLVGLSRLTFPHTHFSQIKLFKCCPTTTFPPSIFFPVKRKLVTIYGVTAY